ncbi:MAG: M48 family metallopeptidase [Flavobacteriales bacterium]|jgi:predicted Zn-dependent protease|nr:M48 family metallopeptidase [Flavobacteriales bacterium]
MNPKRIILPGCILLAVACSKVPVTGRSQFNMVSTGQIASMVNEQYQQTLNTSTILPDSDPRVQMVRGCGQRIAAAVEEFLQTNDLGARVSEYQWEFNVADDPTVNAWCMPGGKVLFYTGILPLTVDETGVAVVMGHEVAHAVARHGNERMSQGILAQGVGMTLDILTSENPGLARNLLLQSVGIGSQLGMLAYSRSHETEADKMGLIFMAMAGYDPREAPKFWERMSAGSGGAAPPELLSTHPSDTRRIADLNAYMPEALKHYRP